MEPHVKPLSLRRRNAFFVFLFLVFFSALPIFMFYASGYRYDFFSDTPAITATGGLYVNIETPNATLYLNEAEVRDARVFRSASYIQGLEPGIHRLHVQASGTATWVKELPVYPHLVTEVEVFNIPLRPQVRPITEYLTRQGEAVVFGTSTFLSSFEVVAPFVATTSRATSTLVANREHDYVSDLFLAHASTTALRARLKARETSFGFATSLPDVDPELVTQATTTRIRDNLRLYEREGEVYVEAIGSGRQVPSYFCTSLEALNETPDLGAAAIAAEAEESPYSSFPLTDAPAGASECRTEIRMDRQGEQVIAFEFLPDNSNLVVMHLESGVYVTEVDDRAWQNSQLLYRGTGLQMVIEGRSIYLKDGDRFFEVFTAIAPV